MRIKEASKLIAKIKSARALSETCRQTYFRKKFVRQQHFAEGQLDAFDAVLRWIFEEKWK